MNNKRIILVSQFINNFGTAFSRIALIILVTTWYKNAIYVGIYSFFLFIPQVVLATPIGYLIDSRRDEKRLLLVSSGPGNSVCGRHGLFPSAFIRLIGRVGGGVFSDF